MSRSNRTAEISERPVVRGHSLFRNQRFTVAYGVSLVASLLLGAIQVSRGQSGAQLNTLHVFRGGAGIPTSDLFFASDGNIYGTTSAYSVSTPSGTSTITTVNGGTLFKMTTDGVFTSLYTFTTESNGVSLNGTSPRGGLTAGSDPTILYGTTSGIVEAITYTSTEVDGTVTVTSTSEGSVFRYDTASNILTTIFTFTNGTDGSGPQGSLVLGSNGPLYGTTSGGTAVITGTTAGTSTLSGTSTGVGSVFTITNTGVVANLSNFTGGAGGSAPIGGLTEGRDGNFYGTTSSGGTVTIAGTTVTNEGTIYQVTPNGQISTLYTFSGGDDGGVPTGKLARPGNGFLYGTTSGGANGYGTIYKVTTAGELTTLYTFSGDSGGDSGVPLAGLIVGYDGNLYGTTSGFGAGGLDGSVGYDFGSIFRITPDGVFTTLYNFTGMDDGGFPEGGLVQDAAGNLYGTTSVGGSKAELGTIFQLALPTTPSFFNGEIELADSVYYLAFPDGNFFGFYSFFSDPNYIYHFDLGYEYVIDAADGKSGVYFYDFDEDDFFYTSPTFPFPYLYSFNLGATLYYYPDQANPGHYTTNPRYFYNFAIGEVISY